MEVTDSRTFHRELLQDIESNRVILPSIPDVVWKIRSAIEDPDTDLDKLVGLIRHDAATSARILKIANSALYGRSTRQSDSLRAAVSRLGTSRINALVTTLAIVQTMHSSNGPVCAHLDKLSEHSSEVAALCYALAKCFTRINPEKAFLAGMLHDIGHLPILQKLAGECRLARDPSQFASLGQELHTQVGGYILRRWNFGEEMINVATMHEDTHYWHAGEPSLLDLVIVADRLLGSRGQPPDGNLTSLPSLAKLNIDLQKDIEENPGFQSLVCEARALLKV